METPGRTVWLNGKLIPEAEAHVSIYDASLQSGDTVFESCRTFGQRPFRLDDHLERLHNSLCLVEMAQPYSKDALGAAVNAVLQENLPTEAADVDWQIQVNIFRGLGTPYDCLPRSPMGPIVFISCWPLINVMGRFAEYYDEGVKLVVPPQRALPAGLWPGKAKTRSRIHFRMAQLQAQRISENCWPLLLDPDGYLAEGPTWSVLVVKAGKILAPEPRNVLPGVSSSVARELAERCGLPFVETNLDYFDANTADELLCLATSFCLVQATSFEGQAIGNQQPGPICRQLTAAWSDLVGIDFVSQAQSYRERYSDWESRQRSS